AAEAQAAIIHTSQQRISSPKVTLNSRSEALCSWSSKRISGRKCFGPRLTRQSIGCFLAVNVGHFCGGYMNWRHRAWKPFLLICAALGLVIPPTQAQTVYGSMAGTVTDPSGAVVAGATVQAKGEQSGATSQTVTTSAGAYRFPELPIGAYDITVTAAGFQPETLTGVRVNLQITTALDVSLKIGA